MQADATTSKTEDELSEAETAKIIAAQNDLFRKAIAGRPMSAGVPPGKLVMTAGIAACSEAFRAALIEALVAFDAFDTASDPYGLHEMGVLKIEGERVWFKFDLYDENYEYGAETPTDPARTRRVLTLLFPSEY